VRLEVGSTSTVLTIDSAGRVGRTNPAGTGLASMKERAEIVGGHLTAGPSDGGWRVQAVLPGAPERAGH